MNNSFFASLTAAVMLTAGAQAFDTKAREAIIIDDETQAVLLAKQAQKQMPPSSMSKLMTLYVLFEKLKSGAITLDSTFPVSEKAWKKGGSKMFVKVGTEVRVEDLIRGIVVQSGNDACIVVAEALGGSEEGFAAIMNQKAKALGLKGSHFANSTGWPHEQHYMTPADLALLSRRLVRDFPDYYPYFAESEFTYSGITQPNRNRLLGRGGGVDGLKTGHTEIAGYGITVSALDSESGRRVHVVVNGLENDADRIAEAGRLADHGLRDFVQRQTRSNQLLDSLPVHYGDKGAVAIGLAEAITVTVPRSTAGLQLELVAEQPLIAPVQQGQLVGALLIKNGDTLMQRLPLVALEPAAPAGIWRRFWINLRRML